MIKSVIFDLDVTLLDTLASLAYYMNLALAEVDLPPIPVDTYRHLVGNGVHKLAEGALAASGVKGDAVALAARFTSVYSGNPLYLVSVYPGIPQLLSSLKSSGIKTAVFTNKPDGAAQSVIKGVFGCGVFETVLGKRDDLPRKPHPDGALLIARQLNVTPDEVLYIGDTDTDMQTASNAGMKSVGVLWGFRDRAELQSNGAAYIAVQPSDITEIINSINGGLL